MQDAKHHSEAPTHRRAFHALTALVLVATGTLAATSSGCGSTTVQSGPYCEGGFVRKDAQGNESCEGKCEPSKCGADNVCIDNRCALSCTSHLHCAPIVEDCVPATDDSGGAVDICQPNGRAPIGLACPLGDGDCASAFACPDGAACDPACTGADCACPADQCKALMCLTNGEGDADAFCTLRDCHADSDCPGGYWCGQLRVPQHICGPTCKSSKCAGGPMDGLGCSKASDCQQGDQSFCGEADDNPCVDPADVAAGGSTLVEGTWCGLQNICRPRRVCSPCETDLDCSAQPYQRCTTLQDNTKACTRDCDTDADCDSGYGCTNGACIPRSGVCVGTGGYCEPCRTDLDCAAGGPTFLCRGFIAGSFERACYDIISKSCNSDANCPVGPDGRHGTCLGEDQGVTPDVSYYHTCDMPYNDAIGVSSCWRSNAGTGCYVNDDCISKKCVGAKPSMGVAGVCQ